MTTKTTTSGTMVVAVLLVTSALSAHHASRLFDTTMPIRVKGSVVRYIWTNPHSSIIVEQKTEHGETIRWALESSAPIHVLEGRGFSKESFQPGDLIEACGFAPWSLSARTDAPNRDSTTPGPAWLEGSDRIITARLLLTQRGPEVHWSHYGPLELCISEEELARRSLVDGSVHRLVSIW